MGQIKVECDPGTTSLALSGNLLSSLRCPATDFDILNFISSESFAQMHLLMQAQMLIRKNDLYDTINQEIKRLFKFQPTVFTALQCQAATYKDCDNEDGSELPLLSFHRDIAVNNIRFLSIFYSSGPNSFYVATNLMDCLLSRIVVTRKALPVVVACCFYLATCYTNESSTPIDPDNLMNLSQCETTREIFLEVVGRIRDEVSFCQQRPVTPLSFLRLFYSVFELNDGLLENGDITAFLITRLELLLCRFEFTKFRYDLLVLAFLQYFLQRVGLLSNSQQLTVLELQYYCRMDEDAYRECFDMIERHTFEYETQETKRPKLKLTWTISRRVLLKRRPSLLVRSNLEPLMEEESPGLTNSPASVPYDDASESLKAESASDHVDRQSEMEQTESEGNESLSNRENEGSEVSVNNGNIETDSAFTGDDKATKKEEAELRVEDDAESMDEVVPRVSCDKVFVDGNGNLCKGNERPANIFDGGMEDGRAFDGRGSEDFKECCSSTETSGLQGSVVSGKRKSERGTAAPRSWIWNHLLMIPAFLFPLKAVSRILSSRLHLWREKVVA